MQMGTTAAAFLCYGTEGNLQYRIQVLHFNRCNNVDNQRTSAAKFSLEKTYPKIHEDAARHGRYNFTNTTGEEQENLTLDFTPNAYEITLRTTQKQIVAAFWLCQTAYSCIQMFSFTRHCYSCRKYQGTCVREPYH